METVEVVIKIPKEDFDFIKDEFADGDMPDEKDLQETTYFAIANSTVLPKGHGRLGDLDTLYEDVTNGIKAGNYEEGYEEYENINDMDDIVDAIKYAPTVIEADKDGE